MDPLGLIIKDFINKYIEIQEKLLNLLSNKIFIDLIFKISYYQFNNEFIITSFNCKYF